MSESIEYSDRKTLAWHTEINEQFNKLVADTEGTPEYDNVDFNAMIQKRYDDLTAEEQYLVRRMYVSDAFWDQSTVGERLLMVVMVENGKL